MPVIVGAPRSGTTLLRFMLDAHPELAIPPETGFLALGSALHTSDERLRERFFEAVTAYPADAPAWNDFGLSKPLFWSLLEQVEPFSVADGYRAFYRAYAHIHGKARWGDKTPGYCLQMAAIEELLPEAHFIHVIRDGRDVALSLREMWFSPGDDIEALAQHWVTHVTTGRQQGSRRAHYLEVRFEELVKDSRLVLQQVCAFLGLRFMPAMLDYHRRTPGRLEEHRDRRRTDGTLVVSHQGRRQQQALTMEPPRASRAQAWRRRMAPAEQVRFEAVAGALLQELGYRR
jgi:hypothetical protein